MALHYLAYGSNLHPLRIQGRVPSARPVGTLELPERSLSFAKRSVDGSAKCTIAPGTREQSVFSAIFEIGDEEKGNLDLAEGLGVGYREIWQKVTVEGTEVRAFAYIAAPDHLEPELAPYHWYKALVLAGARYHGFPREYIARIERVESFHDPDKERCQTNERLLRRIQACSRRPCR